MQAVGGPQLQQQFLERANWNGWLQGQVASIHSSQRFQELLEVAMQQWLAAAACVASLVLLLATIAAGEVAVCLASSMLPAPPSCSQLSSLQAACRVGGPVAHHYEGCGLLP